MTAALALDHPLNAAQFAALRFCVEGERIHAFEWLDLEGRITRDPRRTDRIRLRKRVGRGNVHLIVGIEDLLSLDPYLIEFVPTEAGRGLVKAEDKAAQARKRAARAEARA